MPVSDHLFLLLLARSLEAFVCAVQCWAASFWWQSVACLIWSLSSACGKSIAKILVCCTPMLSPFGQVRFACADQWSCVWCSTAIAALTFLSTLFLNVQYGITIGLAASVCAQLYRTAFPHHCELGRLPNSTFRNRLRFPNSQTYKVCVLLLCFFRSVLPR
jgi:hypothetical protein